MLDQGKLCRYKLHHPMSLGDALAALLRRKPRKQQENPEGLLGLRTKPASDDFEPAVVTAESRDQADADYALPK